MPDSQNSTNLENGEAKEEDQFLQIFAACSHFSQTCCFNRDTLNTESQVTCGNVLPHPQAGSSSLQLHRNWRTKRNRMKQRDKKTVERARRGSFVFIYCNENLTKGRQ